MIHLNTQNQGNYGVYVARKLKNIDQWVSWCKSQGYTDINLDPHVTIAYSRKFFYNKKCPIANITILPQNMKSIEILGDGTVLHFKSNKLRKSWLDKIAAGATWDYPDFLPHITLSYSHQDFKGTLPDFPLVFGSEEETALMDDYIDKVKTAKKK